MSSDTSRNIDPHVVDTQLFNNPKLTAIFSDYQKILNTFPKLSLIAYMNKYTKHVHDPVTAERDFYISLNSPESSSAVQLTDLDNDNISYDILTGDEYKEETSFDSEPYAEPPEEPPDTANLLDTIDDDVQFIIYWVEKFRCIHQTVRDEILNLIPQSDDNDNYDNENTYFNNFNESLFSIRDHQYIKDRSTLSYLNIVSPREQYNKNMMQKVDVDTYETSNDMSSKTSLLFYKNIMQINIDHDNDSRVIDWTGGTPYTPGESTYPAWTADSIQAGSSPALPHGNNNVVDTTHPGRIEENVEAVQMKMTEILGNMKRVFDFLDVRTIEDTQSFGKFNHSMVIRKIWTEVDQSFVKVRDTLPKIPLTTRNNQDLS